MDSCEKGVIDIRRIDISELRAYRLLDEEPIYKYTRSKKVSVLLYGFNKVNYELLRAIYWCGVMDGYSLHVNVIGRNIEEEISTFSRMYPDVFEDKDYVTFINCVDYRKIDEKVRTVSIDADYIVVDTGSDSANLDEAIRIRRNMYYRDATFKNHPVIFVNIHDEKLGNLVKTLHTSEDKLGYDLIPFGISEVMYTYDVIVESGIESLSKCVHMIYENPSSEEDIDKALRKYNRLEVNKRSNRANAMHIKYKLASLGLSCDAGLANDMVDYASLLTDETLERIARLEHIRWMRFMQSEGWTTASLKQVDMYKAAGISNGSHKCPILKLHPFICEYDELKDKSGSLGLEDTTENDRKMVREIPNILHDIWGVSERKYYIVQNKEQQG